MGRHSAPEEPPPPKNKPGYRFFVAILGIALLAFISMAVVAALFPENGSRAVAGQDGNAASPAYPGIPPNTPGAPPEAVQPSVSTSAPPTTAATSRPPTSRPPRTPAGATPSNQPTGRVLGTYGVRDEWVDGFIGQVVLSNTQTTPQHWQVRLVFPDTVSDDKPINSWIEGPGGATFRRDGAALIFESTQPLAPGALITLAFQFAKQGSDLNPRECSVNGMPCTSSP